MLAWLGVSNSWLRRSFWTSENLVASAFYGDAAIRRGFAGSTVSGTALFVLVYSLLGGLFAVVFRGQDRQVRILELLTPHLAQLFRRAAARRSAPVAATGLTPRELEIVRLVAGGMTNREIARELWVSPNTVSKHLENAFEKLGVSNRTAAAARVRALTDAPAA